MASTYPTSLDAFTNPTSSDLLTSPSHSQQHSDINDAVEAIETAIGTTGAPILAPLASPTFTGTPAAPTATAGTSTTQLATTAFVTTADQLLGTYTAYTTTFTNVTVGNGVVNGSYCRVNDFVHYYGSFTLGSTSAVTGTVSFTLPVNLNSDINLRSTYGLCQYLDGSTRYCGQTQRLTDGSLYLCVDAVWATYAMGANINATAPFTWGNTDVMTWNLYYRAA
jgi:hypothetical protein